MKKIKRVVAPEAAHRYSETQELVTIAMSSTTLSSEYSETFACTKIAIFLLKNSLGLEKKKENSCVTRAPLLYFIRS